MTYLFLDTEWADPIGSELVSLALITEDGVHRFYAERDPLPEVATDFVQSVLHPLFERGRWRMTDQAMTTGLRAFLGTLPEPMVVADYPAKRLCGLHFGQDAAYQVACRPLPRVAARCRLEPVCGCTARCP